MLKKKRIISLALAVVLIACSIVLPQLMFANDTEGECGTEASWSYDNESFILSISGKGDLTEYENYDEIPWKSYANEVKVVVVGDEITSLCKGAFANMTALESISFGKLQALPESVCEGDEKLSGVGIDGELLTIGSYAFKDCKSLESFNIPATVTSVGSSILNGTAITSLRIDANLETAGSSFGGAFDIQKLTEVTLGEGVTTIPSYAFYNATALNKINIEGELEEIGECAFASCARLMNFDLGDSLKRIGRNAFSDSAVTSIVINSNLESCGDAMGSAFANSKINRVTFGESVTAIPNNALTYASNVKSVYFMNSECVIPDSKQTIDEAATIYGCYVSTARDYADKYSRKFILICPTGTHNLVKETVEPTCSEQGYVKNTCTVCKLVYGTDYVNPLGHDGKWQISIKPTKKSTGLKLNTCTRCGLILAQQSIPKLEDETTTEQATVPRTTSQATTDNSDDTTATTRYNGTTVIHYVPTAPVTKPNIVALTDISYENFRVIPGEGCLKVSWLVDNRVAGYNIYLSADGKTFKKAGTTKKSTDDFLIIKGLEYNKIYYVKLVGFVGNGIECNQSKAFAIKTK